MQVYDAGRWAWFLQNVLPVLQLPMTIIGTALGAGIGGWVAMRTTTKALDAAAERERAAQEAVAKRDREARELGKRKAHADDLRRNSERYMLLLWKIFSFQADLATNIALWATEMKAISPDELARVQPPSEINAELRVLEQLHLPFLDGHAFQVGDILKTMGEVNVGIVGGIRKKLVENTPELGATYHRANDALMRQLRAKIEEAGAKLREQLHAADLKV